MTCPGIWAQTNPSMGGPFRPFTAKLKETDIWEDGSQKVFFSTFYRKADRSFSRIEETEMPGDERGVATYIFDVPTRTFVEAFTFTDAAMIMHRSASEAQNLLVWSGVYDPDNPSIQVGESEKLGLRTLEMEDRITPKLIARTWMAPDLQHFSLLDLLIENGELRTKKEVLSIEFGEPDAAAFRVPAGFQVVGPVKFDELWKQRYGGQSHFGEEKAKQLEREDAENR